MQVPPTFLSKKSVLGKWNKWDFRIHDHLEIRGHKSKFPLIYPSPLDYMSMGEISFWLLCIFTCQISSVSSSQPPNYLVTLLVLWVLSRGDCTYCIITAPYNAEHDNGNDSNDQFNMQHVALLWYACNPEQLPLPALLCKLIFATLSWTFYENTFEID